MDDSDRPEAFSTPKVKVDGVDVGLHITDQSIMFEKEGKVSGFERSAIRMIKPDGSAMIIAYSVGSEVKSVRIEPMKAVASLMVPSSSPTQTQASVAGLDEVFEKLYRDARKELEEKLLMVEGEPENKGLRLNSEEEKRLAEVTTQMGNILGTKHGFSPWAEDTPISFWGLENQPREVQLAVVKIRQVRFLRLLVGQKAEQSDIVYSTDEVWPQDWPFILDRFGLDNGPYVTSAFSNYIDYLKSFWKDHPSERKPRLARP